jgi:hypothetical protein
MDGPDLILSRGKRFFSSPETPYRLADHPASYLIRIGVHSSGVNLPGHGVDHSPQSNSEVKDDRTTGTSTPPYVFMAWLLIN